MNVSTITGVQSKLKFSMSTENIEFVSIRKISLKQIIATRFHAFNRAFEPHFLIAKKNQFLQLKNFNQS